MSIHPDIRDQAYQFFIEEVPDLLQAIEAGILSLREGRDPKVVHHMMRSAHSLKGGAASVGLDAIKAIAHRLEAIFKALYSEKVEIDNDLETQLLQAFDCLRIPLIDQLSTATFDAAQALAVAESVLTQLETQWAEAIIETENFIPGSADLGINMVASIFEIDVEQGLQHLAIVLADPQVYEVAGELRAQAEVFVGFAELLNLPGFGRIGQAAIQALNHHPDRVLEIAALALADFQAGRSAVLAGDLSEGGSPSAALMALAVPSDAILDTVPDAVLDIVPDADRSNQITVNQAAPDQTTLNQITNTADLNSSESALPDNGILLLEELRQQLDDTALTELNSNQDWLNGFEHLEETENISHSAISQSDTSGLEDIFGELTTNRFTDDLLPSIDPPVGILSSPEVTGQTSEISEATECLDLPIAQDKPSQPDAVSSITAKQQKQAETRSAANPSIKSSSPVPSNLSVRVDADRLMEMNNLLGELIINRNGLALQNDQLRSTIRELLNRFRRFQATVEQLRSVSDHLLITPERTPSFSTANKTETATPSPQPGFDALEMDSYTTLYSQTQTLLEEALQMEEAIEDIALFNRQSEQLLGQHRKMLSKMQDDVMRTRMLPLNRILDRFPRILRDLSHDYQKPVHLTLTGANLLVDKSVLQKLYDPLLHLLRNSFDHGIESPDIRRAQGKPEVGQIEIRAAYKGRQVIIEVRDDGRGVNLERVRQRLVEQKQLSTAPLTPISEAQLYEFIFEPGFSTAEQVSELSGRGMGLDAVREQLRSLKGSVTVHSTPQQGATFTLTLPLTLTVANLLICFVGSTPIAIRSDSISEILIPKAEHLTRSGSQRWLQWQSHHVPAYRMSDLLTYTCLVPEMPPSRVLAAVPSPADWETPMLILKQRQQFFALQVDRLVTEQECVIKPFGVAIAPPEYAYGCTVLGDGSLIPVIDGPAFLEEILHRGRATLSDQKLLNDIELNAIDALTVVVQENAAIGTTKPEIRMTQTTTVLVVDDAVTSRQMLTLSLERAGYRVLQARDGQEALEQLQQSQSVQLIVCDIEMPNMNGFEFLAQRRQIPEFDRIPTIMLTSRSNPKHRWFAMQLGATAYFTKPYLEQEFLGAIAAYLHP